MYSIVDLHMHVVPGIDDGSCSIKESLELLKLSIQQGVTDVFCTSHSGCVMKNAQKYNTNIIAIIDKIIIDNTFIITHRQSVIKNMPHSVTLSLEIKQVVCRSVHLNSHTFLDFKTKAA